MVVVGRFGETVLKQVVAMRGQALRDETRHNISKTKAVNLVLDRAKDIGAMTALTDIGWVTIEHKYLGVGVDLEWCKIWCAQRIQVCKKLGYVGAEVCSMVGQWHGHVPWNVRKPMHRSRTKIVCLHGTEIGCSGLNSRRDPLVKCEAQALRALVANSKTSNACCLWLLKLLPISFESHLKCLRGARRLMEKGDQLEL